MQRRPRLHWFVLGICGLALCLWGQSADAGVDYEDPVGGWTYIYDGVGDADGVDFTSLDGTWDHDNGSDQWDGTGFFEGRPGGVIAIEDGGVTFLRMQDTGDPSGQFPDPGSNRKFYFGHDITDEGAADTVLDDGVTLTFRARVPTGEGFTEPYPPGGDGYVNHNGGKSTFTIKQNAGGSISFFLALEDEDETGFDGGGLGMNSVSGTDVSGDVDWQGDDEVPNLLPLDDPTEWHEFWVNIFAPGLNGEGTHTVAVYADGSLDAVPFEVTAGDGSDYDDFSYLAVGMGSTPQSGAVDIDFFGWTSGLIEPTIGPIDDPGDFNGDGLWDTVDIDLLGKEIIAGTNDPAFDMTDDGVVDLADQDEWRQVGADKNGFAAAYLKGDANLDGTVDAADLNAVGINWQTSPDPWSQGDFDASGFVDAGDLNLLGLNWQDSIPAAASNAAVPEPSSALLVLFATSLFLIRRCR